MRKAHGGDSKKKEDQINSCINKFDFSQPIPINDFNVDLNHTHDEYASKESLNRAFKQSQEK